MPAAPLFVTDRAALLTDLRLGKVPTDNGATGVIDAAIVAARAQLHMLLGQGLITSLSATSYSDVPTTDAGYLRLAASQLETEQVRLELLKRLPVGFMDGSGDVDESWDTSAPFFEPAGDGGSKALARYKTSIKSDIAQIVDYLKGSVKAGEATTVRTSVIGSTDTPRAPGSHIFPTGLNRYTTGS